MYTVTINDSVSFNDLRLNGNNFVSSVEIDASAFPKAPFTAKISDGETETTMENVELVQVRQYGDEWWFILREIPVDELERKNMISQIQILEEALNMILTGVTE